eukprot:scaffold18685_cov58-Attheya_sp.AAC.2
MIFHAASGTTQRFLAESIQPNRSLMGPIDVARSCGSNPGIFIAIGRLVVEFSPLFHAEFIASS